MPRPEGPKCNCAGELDPHEPCSEKGSDGWKSVETSQRCQSRFGKTAGSFAGFCVGALQGFMIYCWEV